MLKTLFFGTSAFALPSLDVVADRTELHGVVTQADRPAGRGLHLQSSPVKRAATERALPVYEPASLRAFASEISSLAFDAFVVASYGKILPRDLLEMPALGSLNVHPSLLPRYRGATPIQAALLAGDAEAGVTIMLMDEGMDTGDVVAQERLTIAADEDFSTLHDRLAELGAQTLGRALERGEREGFFCHRPQMGEASVTRPISKADLALDWRWPVARIVNHVRAYAPTPAARAVLGGTLVKVLDVRALERETASPGTPLGIRDESVAVACGDGAVAVRALIAPNHGRESGAAFARRTGLDSLGLA
ncbi:MAG: methionyl-tRNA formyltransferase [Candidatus Tyrphobacter sp.]